MENAFFEMVKKWTVNDYRTPGIKSEVILDMLLSEFIEDLISYHYRAKGVTEVKLLAKEFPIRTNNSNLLNAKVDYLVGMNKNGQGLLLLVELKTTRDSYSPDQEDRIKEAAESSTKDLVDFYMKIVNLKNGNSFDNRKYQDAFQKLCAKEQLADGNIKKIKDIMETEYSSPTQKCLYIFLNDNEKCSQEKLILTDFCAQGKYAQNFKDTIFDAERRQLWESVSMILQECAEFEKPQSPKSKGCDWL